MKNPLVLPLIFDMEPSESHATRIRSDRVRFRSLVSVLGPFWSRFGSVWLLFGSFWARVGFELCPFWVRVGAVGAVWK